MSAYIYERPDWPQFRWNRNELGRPLTAVRHRQGRLLGRMEALGLPLREEAVLNTLTEDVLKSSEIEGEVLDNDQVRSSVARYLGIEVAGLVAADRHVDGVVEMTLDATQHYKDALTADRLFGWHAALFPAGRSGLRKIAVGAWRTDETGRMQVVSSPDGRRETVHYEAPPAAAIDAEMKAFLDWFNRDDGEDPVIRAALAHLWFITIHPFDDGNGRIARAIADMSLARSEDSPQRFYSMSAQIRAERKSYYDLLEATQQGDLDVTPWLMWFLGCLDRAFESADRILAAVLRKAAFWKQHETKQLNDRQREVLSRLLDGFEGKLTSSKYGKIAKTSPDTALRDINGLVALGILRKDEGGGRSTSYSLAEL